MDPTRFDRLVRALGRSTSRRTTLTGLLTALLAVELPDGEATARRRRHRRDHDQRHKRRKKKRGQRDDGGQPSEPAPTGCCGTEACPQPEPGGARAGCAYAGRSFAGQDLHGSLFRGIDGREANFNQSDNHGSVFADACLQGASFRRANLVGTTWSGACLFDADFTGADLGSDAAGFADALFCGTFMPDGSVNDRDCERATSCCQRSVEPGPSCQSAADCADQPCQAKACQNGQCVYDEVFTGPSPNDLCTFCCDGDCCLSPANQCNTENSCCAPNCAGRVCGPDGCGGAGTCGPCAVLAGRRCTAQGQCVCDAISCPDGCCDGNADCWPGDSNAHCGPRGGTCATCTGQGVCRNGQCVCTPDCANRQCGPDGCGGSCGDCPNGQRCQNGQCGCDAQSCPNGCCDANGSCRPGTAKGACGRGGAACATCPQGQDCFGQQCAACGAQTCSDGCCAADGTCQSGFAITACGGPAGAPCQPCTNQQTCQNRECKDCGLECICTGQSICADPDAPNITCPGPSPGELGECYVSQTGQPICGGGIVALPPPGCTSDADCQEYGAGAVCVDAVNVPNQPQCAGVPFCVTPFCARDCAGKVCGPDGCGGTCGGPCGPCERCENGTCQTLQPNGASCSQDSECCSGNCFADICADKVTNCGRNVCNPPAKGCLDDLCCSCPSVEQCCAGGCCGGDQRCCGGVTCCSNSEVCEDGSCNPG
jgi:hypothetical protein